MNSVACGEKEATALVLWRKHLIELLQERPEGFSDGQKLIAGQPHRPYIS